MVTSVPTQAKWGNRQQESKSLLFKLILNLSLMKNLKGPPLLSKRHPPTPSFGLCLNPLTSGIPEFCISCAILSKCFFSCLQFVLGVAQRHHLLQSSCNKIQASFIIIVLKRNLKMLKNFKFQLKSVYRYISSSVSSFELHGF